MNRITALTVLALLVACSPSDDSLPPAERAPAAATPASAPPGSVVAPSTPEVPAKHASANGVVQSIDASAGTLVIAHEPVPALDWPAMTMTFQAPGVDLSGLQAGDAVVIEFTAVGMDATIVSISRQ